MPHSGHRYGFSASDLDEPARDDPAPDVPRLEASTVGKLVELRLDEAFCWGELGGVLSRKLMSDFFRPPMGPD